MFDAQKSQILSRTQRRDRADRRNIALWTFQGWLTMILVAAGYAKVTESMISLQILLGWAQPDQETFIRSLGWAEICIGMTPLATLFFGEFGRTLLKFGVAAISIMAVFLILLHGLRLEPGAVVLNMLILALAGSIFLGRFHAEAAP